MENPGATTASAHAQAMPGESYHSADAHPHSVFTHLPGPWAAPPSQIVWIQQTEEAAAYPVCQDSQGLSPGMLPPFAINRLLAQKAMHGSCTESVALPSPDPPLDLSFTAAPLDSSVQSEHSASRDGLPHEGAAAAASNRAMAAALPSPVDGGQEKRRDATTSISAVEEMELQCDDDAGGGAQNGGVVYDTDDIEDQQPHSGAPTPFDNPFSAPSFPQLSPAYCSVIHHPLAPSGSGSPGSLGDESPRGLAHEHPTEDAAPPEHPTRSLIYPEQMFRSSRATFEYVNGDLSAQSSELSDRGSPDVQLISATGERPRALDYSSSADMSSRQPGAGASYLPPTYCQSAPYFTYGSYFSGMGGSGGSNNGGPLNLSYQGHGAESGLSPAIAGSSGAPAISTNGNAYSSSSGFDVMGQLGFGCGGDMAAQSSYLGQNAMGGGCHMQSTANADPLGLDDLEDIDLDGLQEFLQEGTFGQLSHGALDPALFMSQPPPSLDSVSVRQTDDLISDQQAFANSSAYQGYGSSQLQTSFQASQDMFPQPLPLVVEKEEEVEEDDADGEDLGHAATYADYTPAKLSIGRNHPDRVVETSTLSSVPLPDITYHLHMPDYAISSGKLSALQLEAITYSCQRHESILPNGQRAGFLIGDGAGVGKGRTVAGIILENYCCGRKKALWFSVSNDLKYDAERDLNDIGARSIPVHSLNKIKYGSTDRRMREGVLFATYSALIGESFATGTMRTRIKQVLDWCGPEFDGVVVFDECHKAKNLCPVGAAKPTKTGKAVLDLQNKLPHARVVYASATGASEPKNMAYMSRLGIWGKDTPFNTFDEFLQSIERRGVGGMEIVAMDMKLSGMYIARQLSFHGVTFRVVEIPLPEQFRNVYDRAVKLWLEMMDKFDRAASVCPDVSRKSLWGQFWSSHQRFFKYMCIAGKVQQAVTLAHEALKQGKCVVIGLQSTGEARTREELELGNGTIDKFVSAAGGVLKALIKKNFPSGKARVRAAPKRIIRQECADACSKADMKRRRLNERCGRKGKLARLKEGASATTVTPAMAALLGCPQARDSDDSGLEFRSEGESDDGGAAASPLPPLGAPPPMLTMPPYGSATSAAAAMMNAFRTAQQENGGRTIKVEEEDDDDDDVIIITPEDPARAMTSAAAVPIDYSGMLFEMKQDLLRKVDELTKDLPLNTLDELIEKLGGPSIVAEMTGRKGRIVQKADGKVAYETRAEPGVHIDIVNIKEKQRFMTGEKHVAIISEAASSGISLQADRRAENKRRRVHMTLELPWSADRAIQQFGRTHRSNQVSAPEYLFLISELAGERRFASIVAKRLESLGALTHGDRRATESRDMSRFNFDNKYGREAMEKVLKSLINQIDFHYMVPPPASYEGDFFEDMRQGLVGVGLITKDYKGNYSIEKGMNQYSHNGVQLGPNQELGLAKFLNRILGMEVTKQNAIFQYFIETFEVTIDAAKKEGKYDMGILDLAPGVEEINEEKKHTFKIPSSMGSGQVVLYTVKVDRGISWNDALERSKKMTGLNDGFYVMKLMRSGRQMAILAEEFDKEKKLFAIYRPNTGKQRHQEELRDLSRKYDKVTEEEAEDVWKYQYDWSFDSCSHAFWSGRCRNVAALGSCSHGGRLCLHHVLCGTLLSVWRGVEDAIQQVTNSTSMQIVRLQTKDKRRQVGIKIPENCLSKVMKVLANQDQALLLARESVIVPYPSSPSALFIDESFPDGLNG
ncbi:protein strawberry notch homolog 1-like isoform X3 [Lethenteron reissneri]|uniref:protein strawberry notch homolog 1-like isoform X3 n=1 Tax=Lethenteron reissneri TaxID=7753 RepID=UPI002AB7EB52|nr:protein strawberry notch homolog 1-like isoform X3 [Lethenteron reissneri]